MNEETRDIFDNLSININIWYCNRCRERERCKDQLQSCTIGKEEREIEDAQ